MKKLKTFEDYSNLDKQDKKIAKRNQISNFPHSAKEHAKKKEKRENRSRKEDPDGMYPRDDKRYDNSSHQGGWQDGMGKPSWLGESIETNANVEQQLVYFFESFKEYNIDRQWIVDRFNDEETKRFINYVSEKLQ